MYGKMNHAITERAEPMIGEAAAFAEKAHRSAFREGADIPYITHLLETTVIVSAFTDDEEMIVAVLLRGVMEDARATKGELEETFGVEVTCLVMDKSEDKRKTWQERREYTVWHLSTASRDIKILALGDKLNNMRSMARDHLVMGGAIWQRFNEKNRKKHAWYYWGIAHALKELEERMYYQEYIMLCGNVFGPDVYLFEEEFPHNYSS